MSYWGGVPETRFWDGAQTISEIGWTGGCFDPAQGTSAWDREDGVVGMGEFDEDINLRVPFSLSLFSFPFLFPRWFLLFVPFCLNPLFC